jgi:multidrug efflux pump subunit AcrA (membrane-fusion protein)
MKIPQFISKIMSKKRLILAITTVVGLGLIGLMVFSSGPAETYVTAEVVAKDIRKTVDVTGELQSVTDVSLALGASGTVSQVPVSVGETVRAGDLLVALAAAEEVAAVEQARQNVAQAQAELDLKLDGATVEDIAIKEAAVRSAQATYAGAAADYEAKTVLTAAQVAAAELTLAQAQAEQVETLLQSAENLSIEARSTVISVRNSLTKADEVLGNENQLVNLEYRDYLGGIRPNILSLANSAYDRAQEARDLADQAVLGIGGTVTGEEALILQDRLSRALLETSSALNYTAQLLDSTVVDTNDFSSDDLLALKSSVNTARTALAQAEAGWRGAYQSYVTTARVQADAVATAEINLTSVRAQVASTRSTAASTLESRQAELEQVQADLARTLAKPRGAELAGLEAILGARTADLRAAQARLAQTQIIAPVDGKVTAIDIDVGERAAAGTPLVTVMSTGQAYEIAVDISESDIALVQPGAVAEVTFDAFGDDLTWQGSVLTVEPASKLIEGVVFYEAKILLSDGQDLTNLKPGMSADVVVISAEQTGAVIVPQRAVLEKDGGKYVRVMTGEATYEDRAVEVGLRADDGETQILSGLKPGEEVLLTVREN